jgi:hypothetical protein
MHADLIARRWWSTTPSLVMAMTIALASGCGGGGPAVSSEGGMTGSTGGGNGSGGTPGSGGRPGTGGTTGTGGVASSGGESGTGSVSGTGGGGAQPGSGGGGGAGGSGGGVATGGSGPAGGTGGVAGAGGGAKGGASGAGGTAGAAGAAGGGGGAGGGAAAACSYYLDSAAGSDANDGMSSSHAWQSLTKVNGFTFQPGNKLCFKAGGSWSGQLWPKGSGSAAAPIVIDQYGTGSKPLIAAAASGADAFHLLNQQYWEINNLEITNQQSSVGDYRGISINGQNGGTLNHIYIRNCFVHDVTGEVDWIGGSSSDNAPGITFQTGWDASKKTGGIVFDVQAGTGTAVKTKFNDILIENNTVQDCSFGGIIFKQLDGTVHWGTRSSASSSTWTPHTSVTVRGNYISQLNTSYGCNGLYLTNLQNGLVEQNVVNGAGTSAMELYYTDAVTVQHNETFATKVKAGGADSNGMDTDTATTKTIIQYNYFHDNGDGILICQFSFGDSVIRYNILQNNSRYQIYLHSDPAASSAVYNNTVWNGKTNQGVVYGYGTSLSASYTLTNNIFVAAAGNGVLTTGGGIVYQNNLYSGSAVMIPAGDAKAIDADPKLVAPGTGTSGDAGGPAFGSLTGYQLASGSPAINAGASISNNGGLDFFGDALYAGSPDVGAYEAPGK